MATKPSELLVIDKRDIITSPTLRGLGILARQQAMMLDVPEFWDEIDHISILDENPTLASEPVIVRKAFAIRRLLLSMPISIEDDELIVGTFRAKRVDQPRLPDYTTAEEKARFGKRELGHYGHCAADYGTLIKVGLKGIRAEAQAALQALSSNDSSAAKHKAAFYRSIIICCDTVRSFAERYATLAEQLADTERDPTRVEELHKIANVCRRVPENPAASFHEALQSVLLYHAAIHSVNFDGALGRLDQWLYPLLQSDLDKGVITIEQAQELLDCFLLKVNDCAWHGALTGDDPSRGLFGGFFTRGGGLHNIMLGGQTNDGQDATNLVTYMILDSLRRLAFIYPIISVRLHRKTDDKLIRACCEALRAGAGAPTLYNDELFVPSLVNAGVPLEDARDYVNDGCWEVTVCGKTLFFYISFSAVKFLEWVLTRGRGLPVDWKRALGWKIGQAYEPVPPSELSVEWPADLEPRGPAYRADATDGVRSIGQPYGNPIDTGDPCAFQTFEELMGALEQQLDHHIEKVMRDYLQQFTSEAAVEFGVRGPAPLGSAVIGDCLKKGKGFGHGGERYHIVGLNLNTIPNVTDALCAIRKFVYEDKLFTMAELIELLRNNFEGAEDVRFMLVTRAPKYGNGDEAADALAARLLNFLADSVEKHARELPTPEGYRLMWGLLSGTFEWAARYGGCIGATPDGRRASEPVATNLTPSIGMAMEGPTAALRSYTSLPLHRIWTGGPLDLSIDGTTLTGQTGLERLMGFVRSFVELGGGIMTINIANSETLRQAQKEPSKYRHLRVRLGGQQAYFTGLTRDLQDSIIARFEGALPTS